MIIIRFATAEAERRALGFLAGRFSFKSWASGETLVPEEALPSLTRQGIPFTSERTLSTDRHADDESPR